MIGNRSHLVRDYQELSSGICYFLEDSKEVSMEKICDKKLSMLFTGKRVFCGVLDFKLLNENLVLLKFPGKTTCILLDMNYVGFFKRFCWVFFRAKKDEIVASKQLILLAIPSTGPLGKFDGKSDEGFLVGYSVNSKAFRVYNLVTKRIEVNLHVNFLEEKPNVQGIGHRKAAVSDTIAKKKSHSPKQSSSTPISKSADDIMTFRKELDALALKHLGPVPTKAPTSTNPVNTGSGNLNTGNEQVTPGNIEAVSPSANNAEEVFSDEDDDEMPEIRIYDKSSEGIFEKASYDDDGIISDFSYNLRRGSLKSPLKMELVEAMQEELDDCQKQSKAGSQGHRQEEGIDYDEVFAPVARIEAIRSMSQIFLGFVDPAHSYNRIYKVVNAGMGLHRKPLEPCSYFVKFLGNSKDFSSTMCQEDLSRQSTTGPSSTKCGSNTISAGTILLIILVQIIHKHFNFPQPITSTPHRQHITPPTLTHYEQPPLNQSSVQPTATTPLTQPVETTSSPPISTIPDTQPTLPPSPQIPSPSYHDTEGPSFEPSYHMSPPPSHEPEIQASRSSEESEQLREPDGLIVPGWNQEQILGIIGTK
ncbi:retrovirus-related pol polyprotein from transposon TNT 1-94 [Tanacetum coccineum]